MSFSSEQKRPFSGRNQSDQIILDDLSADDAEYNSKSAATRPNMICPVCDKCFSNKSNLKSHVKRFHPTFDVKNFGSRILEFKCDKCERQFSLEKNLKFHKRKHLDNFVERLVVCPVCRQEKEEHLMRDHYAECHEIQIQTSEMSFHSFEDFSAWKIDMEKSTKSSYVRCGERKNKDGTVKRYYHCHRSGTFSSESQGVRHLKRGGSCKMDAKCPASLKVKIKANGECFAEFQSVHAGHDGDIGYIALSCEERASLAMKIAAKIPFDVILDEVRDSVTESSLERLHLLTKKDLHNIEKCFDITSESSKHSNDCFSIELWIKEMQETENPCVLYYKAYDVEAENDKFLKKEDFVLVIMTAAQSEILQKFSSDCICIDGTHGICNYGFQLMTLLVLDDLRQGFPCAFLISNRADNLVLKLFYSCVKNKTGLLSPRVFMSDMAEAFYNAWKEIMNIPAFRLYCSWHVDRAWRQNLKKINGVEKKALAYKMLTCLLKETDIETFKVMANSVLKILSDDDDTKDFARYFSSEYMSCPSSWAYCYRVYSRLNTNMHIERMHRTIKYIYLNGKKTKRLDKSIHAIMKFVRDKLIDRLYIMHKGKLTSKLAELRKRHKTSLSMKVQTAKIDDHYFITSESSYDTYEVVKVIDDCNCKLRCDACKTCIHEYACSCIDYSIKWNMCKHVHFLCTNVIKEETATSNTDHSTLVIDEDNESQVILKELSHPRTEENLDKFKESLLREYSEMINSLENVNQCKIMAKRKKTLLVELNAEKETPARFLPQTSKAREPANKNIVPQRKFKSVRKRKLEASTCYVAQNVILNL